MKPGLRPLRRVRPGVWRSRDERFEFVGGRAIMRASSVVWWDAYERDGVEHDPNEPVYADREPTLADLVDRVAHDFYRD